MLFRYIFIYIIIYSQAWLRPKCSVGKNRGRAKNIFKRVSYEVELETRAMKENNDKKTYFLVIHKKKIKLNIDKYNKLSIYQGDYPKVNKNRRSEFQKQRDPVLSGGVELDSEEESVIRLPPKFYVLGTLKSD